MALNVGDKAPSFKLKNQDAKVISLADLKENQSFYISIQRMIHRAAQKKRATSEMNFQSWKNESRNNRNKCRFNSIA